MSERGSDASERWVICLLVTGDPGGVMAVSAEGLFTTALLDQPEGAQPVTSTVARFADLSDEEQRRWNAQLQREADDW